MCKKPITSIEYNIIHGILSNHLNINNLVSDLDNEGLVNRFLFLVELLRKYETQFFNRKDDIVFLNDFLENMINLMKDGFNYLGCIHYAETIYELLD